MILDRERDANGENRQTPWNAVSLPLAEPSAEALHRPEAFAGARRRAAVRRWRELKAGVRQRRGMAARNILDDLLAQVTAQLPGVAAVADREIDLRA